MSRIQTDFDIQIISDHWGNVDEINFRELRARFKKGWETTGQPFMHKSHLCIALAKYGHQEDEQTK